MEPEAARPLLVRRGNASRHIRELGVNEEELEKMAVAKAMSEADRELGGTLQRWKHLPETERFLAQFHKPLRRHSFLVLSGPSRLGKTVYARSLCPPNMAVLEINCAGGAEPDLRAYRLSKHGLILFDEIVAGQVERQRKLFQAQSAPVQLGCSATNCHSYTVFTWRKPMVLCSNNWESSLLELRKADQDWVKANSIVLHVTEPMWIE